MQMRTKIFNRCVITSILILACASLMAQQPKKPATPPKADDAKKAAASGEKIDLNKNKVITGPSATGVIKDAITGKPLAAINVSIPDYSAALTDDNGKFTIKVPDYNVTLFISGEGFQTKEVALRGKKEISTALYEDSYNSIYDIANLPYGAKPKNQSVNAVASVNTTDNWARSTETADGYLQGKVAGLNPTMRSGTPNAGAYLNVRGYNSLYATNQPLVVVDGMIYDYNDYGSSLIANHYTNALGDIDMRDIENITVIKDGSSTYGTKGANGVILITTAHAQQLATRIDAGIYTGVNYAPKYLPVMKAGDYRTYLTDVLKSRGWSNAQILAQPYISDDTSSANPNYYRYHNQTNWQDEAFSNSTNNNYYVKVSGGDNIAKYVLSMGYMSTPSVTRGTSLKKYNIRLNADLNLSRRLTATTSLTFNFFEQSLRDQGMAVKTNPIYLALTKAPFVNKNVIADNGLVSPNLSDTDTLGVGNPTAIAQNMIGTNKVYRFFGSITLKYSLTRYLSIGSLIGTTVDEVREQYFVPRKGVSNDTIGNAVIDSRLGGQAKRIYSIYNDTYLDYSRTFNRVHVLTTRLGLRYLDSKNEQDYATGANSATDDFISVGTGSNTLRKVGGGIGRYGWINTYLGIDYALKNKYFFTYNMAIDASSRFGASVPNALHIGSRSYAVMPSLGASWLVSSEKFMSKIKFVDVLKLRATISKTGNDDIGNYTAKQSYVSQNLLGVQGLVRANVANPYLQWETNTKSNLGLDLALFNERINLSVDVFTNKTDNMLAFEPLPVASGYAYAITNTGSMKTTGADFSLNTRIINKKSFKWDLGITVTAYKNRITSLPGNSTITNYGGATILTQVGAPVSSFYGYKTNGVYTSDAEAATDGLTKLQTDGTYANYKGGDIRFIDVNGDKKIDDNDRQFLGNPTPDFVGGFSTRIVWKRFSLDAMFTFSKGNQVYNGVRAALEAQSTTENQLESVINRWRVPGQVTNTPRVSYGDPMGNSSFSDRWIEDGSYLRLKTITASYQLPIKAGKALRYVTLYVTGNNLLTFTKYLGFDPEFYSSETVLARGVDIGLEPQFKSFVTGLRIGL